MAFHNKVNTLSHQTKYKTKFVSHKQYFISLLTSRNAKKTQTNQSIPYNFFTLSEKKESTKLEKWQLKKPLSTMCMLLVQLASVNVFYSI